MDKEASKIFLHTLRGKSYESGVSIITPSGERHDAIQRTRYYIERQTFNGPIQWIISDDSNKHYEITKPSNVTYFDHKKRTYPGNKSDSFRGNVICALPLVKFDKVLIFEDDDWYHPDYIKTYVNYLFNYQLVGEAPAKYYNVKTRNCRTLGNNKRASFCQTGLRSNILDKLFVSCQKDSAFVDARLWNKDCSKFISQADRFHCVGIKGMPGRAGIGIGHRMKGSSNDPNLSTLTKWIGADDAQYYAKFFQKL
jgi:cellulose synthase/poly-beta-1,6-N-acetylglucosamine synthase-like glycosyltransferase